MAPGTNTTRWIAGIAASLRSRIDKARAPLTEISSGLLQSFSGSRGGSTAVLFTLALVPIIALAGLGIDYARALRVRTDIQQALDYTALAALSAAATSNEHQLHQTINALFVEHLRAYDAQKTKVAIQYNAATSTLDLSATATIPTTLLQVLGIPEIPVRASSQAAAGLGKLELAMVLDNTGSMSSNGKIQALISASHQLLATLQAAAGSPGAVKVSIVPFDTHVNVGLGSLTEPWIDWSFYDPADTYGTGSDLQQAAFPGCTSGMANGDSNDNGKAKCKTAVVQAFNASWTGCVIDRDMPYDIENSLPTADPATFYPAMDCTLAPLLPLTTDWAALNATVDLMHASGSTDLPIGLVWGWNMLSQGAPLSNAGPLSADTKRVIVFLTDGDNTKNAWTTNSSDIDARTVAVCNNIKADGVQIFTIRVMNGNAALLQNCASDPSMYYDVTQSNQMAAAFQAFTQSMVQPPHLTR